MFYFHRRIDIAQLFRVTPVSLMNQEMHKINDHFPALIAEWNKANTWADLSCFANVDRINLEPAAQSVDALVKDAKQQVKDERDRLDKLHEIDKDAKDFNSLIQDQARSTICDTFASLDQTRVSAFMPVLTVPLLFCAHRWYGVKTWFARLPLPWIRTFPTFANK